LWAQQLGIMQQYRASAFYTVVHQHKLNEVNNECTSHFLLSWLSVCRKLANLVKIWRSS